MDQSLEIGRLTASQVDEDGKKIRLSAEDSAGGTLHLYLSVEQVGSLAMTLLHLLSTALKMRYRDSTLKFVFPLNFFELEDADPVCLVTSVWPKQSLISSTASQAFL
jgi:hypothetical protein